MSLIGKVFLTFLIIKEILLSTFVCNSKLSRNSKRSFPISKLNYLQQRMIETREAQPQLESERKDKSPKLDRLLLVLGLGLKVLPCVNLWKKHEYFVKSLWQCSSRFLKPNLPSLGRAVGTNVRPEYHEFGPNLKPEGH